MCPSQSLESPFRIKSVRIKKINRLAAVINMDKEEEEGGEGDCRWFS
jgi:hypothetical protein